MFGFVVADRGTLTEEQLIRYRGCYCGLCRCIGHTYGTLPRLALNYDMTFLVLLLSSLYEPEETADCRVCAVHPFRKQEYWQSSVTQYAAAMNMALAYYNTLDDWQDERKASSYVLSSLFRSAATEAAKAYPRQWHAMETCMETLGELEASDSQNADVGANAFGDLMAELLVWREDRWSSLLRQMGHALGRFIYLMDAVLDLPEDRKKGCYNPLSHSDPQYYEPLLTMFLGECTDILERLPLVQDLDILRNILYSGVWTRWRGHFRKEAPHV